jgi:hypothetical protein
VLTPGSNSQLAVVKGVVADRIQKLTLGPSIMGKRCCRASYGMVCMELYNRTKHVGLPTWTDPLDKKVYVLDQIDWFVKKVGVPPISPIEHCIWRALLMASRESPFTLIAQSYTTLLEK